VIEAASLQGVRDRATTARNLIAMTDSLTTDGLRALAAVERLGDRPG
jgi:hypothetical protein